MYNDPDAPLVSAVIPTRNRPLLVCRAVRSALDQTFGAIEVVVVVDGPDPETEKALNSIADSRLRMIALPNNVGGGEARNVGVRAAKGNTLRCWTMTTSGCLQKSKSSCGQLWSPVQLPPTFLWLVSTSRGTTSLN